MKVLGLALLSLGASACSTPCLSGECGGVQDTDVLRAKVTDVSSGETLVEVCAKKSDPDAHAKVRFRARAGATVEERVLFETVTEEYQGHDAPVHAGSAFWCSDVPKHLGGGTGRLLSANICLEVSDEDPPAKILEIAPRGDVFGQRSTGYTLKLEILHSGLLHVRLNGECEGMAFGRPSPDGGLLPRDERVELEVL